MKSRPRLTEVEDEVHSGPLLHHLEGSAEDDATNVTGLVPERSREACRPLSDVAGRGDVLALVLGVGDDPARGFSTSARESGLGEGKRRTRQVPVG